MTPIPMNHSSIPGQDLNPFIVAMSNSAIVVRAWSSVRADVHPTFPNSHPLTFKS